MILSLIRPPRREVLECGGRRGTVLTPLWPSLRAPKTKRCVPPPLTHRTPRHWRARATALRFWWAKCEISRTESALRTGPGTTRSSAIRILAWLLIFGSTVNFFAAGTNTLSEAEIEGRKLVRQILDLRPAENFTNSGILRIREKKAKWQEFPLQCAVIVTETNWISRYAAKFGDHPTDITTLIVTHIGGGSNRYVLFDNEQTSGVGHGVDLHIGMGVSGDRTMKPFAGSDFWLCDLGLEFFHWPEQKVLKHEMRRGQGCKVLESTNPEASTNGYSRVVSWIDNDTLGIVQAEAYDAKGKLLKEFAPKEFKKVNGQWQLQEMEIRNVQTGSRTRLEFNLEK